jgi:hypothetical protein
MKLIIYYLAIIFTLISQSSGRDADWFSRRLNDLENTLKIENTNDRIFSLSQFMSIASHGEMDEEREMIFKRAQTELLAIPGHAKCFQNKIEEMRVGVLVDSKKTPETLQEMQNNGEKIFWEAEYLSFSTAALRTLRFMPSAETVSVLGHFLNDPESLDGKTLLGNDVVRPGDDFQKRPANAEQAADSIRKLGIEHPPFKNIDGKIMAEEVEAWKEWWNEVKDGKRTYRFIGSKIEYGPDGPASQDVIQRVERDQKRDDERKTGVRKSSTVTEANSSAGSAAKPLSIAGIIAACILIAGVSWYYLRGRRAA